MTTMTRFHLLIIFASAPLAVALAGALGCSDDLPSRPPLGDDVGIGLGDAVSVRLVEADALSGLELGSGCW